MKDWKESYRQLTVNVAKIRLLGEEYLAAEAEKCLDLARDLKKNPDGSVKNDAARGIFLKTSGELIEEAKRRLKVEMPAFLVHNDGKTE